MKKTGLSIVIPAYNEEKRLPPTLQDLQKAIPEHNWPVLEVLVVDDGSKDDTLGQVALQTASFPQLKALRLQPNQGKGAAIREGVLQSQGAWVLVADADQSTPWSELNKLMKIAEQNNADLVMGSRALKESDIRIRQSPMREMMGKTFNKILRAICGLPFKDTQCGFKLFRNSEDLQQVFQVLVTRRFAYDVEVIMRMRDQKKIIMEAPVTWSHQEESRVHPLFDSMEMLKSVIWVRLKMWLDF